MMRKIVDTIVATGKRVHTEVVVGAGRAFAAGVNPNTAGDIAQAATAGRGPAAVAATAAITAFVGIKESEEGPQHAQKIDAERTKGTEPGASR